MHRVLRESGGQSLLRLLRAQIAPGIGGEVRYGTQLRTWYGTTRLTTLSTPPPRRRSLAARSPWLWDDTLTDGRRTTAADRAHYSKKSKGGSRDGASKAAGSAGSGADDGEAFDLGQFRGMMRKSVDHFQHELANIRMGRCAVDLWRLALGVRPESLALVLTYSLARARPCSRPSSIYACVPGQPPVCWITCT